MLIGKIERRDEFPVGTRLRIWDRENEDLDASLASGSEIDVLVVFGELQEYVSSNS